MSGLSDWSWLCLIGPSWSPIVVADISKSVYVTRAVVFSAIVRVWDSFLVGSSVGPVPVDRPLSLFRLFAHAVLLFRSCPVAGWFFSFSFSFVCSCRFAVSLMPCCRLRACRVVIPSCRLVACVSTPSTGLVADNNYIIHRLARAR